MIDCVIEIRKPYFRKHIENFVMWLGFFKECRVSLIHRGINLLWLSTTFFWSQVKLWSAYWHCFAVSFFFTIAIFGRSFAFIWTRFWRPFSFTEVHCFVITTANFISDVVFIFCGYWRSFFYKFIHATCFQYRKWIFFVRSKYTA